MSKMQQNELGKRIHDVTGIPLDDANHIAEFELQMPSNLFADMLKHHALMAEKFPEYVYLSLGLDDPKATYMEAKVSKDALNQRGGVILRLIHHTEDIKWLIKR